MKPNDLYKNDSDIDISTEDFDTDNFNPLELLEIDDNKDNDFGINIKPSNQNKNGYDELVVENKHVFRRNNKLRDKVTKTLKTDRKYVLDSIIDSSKSYKLNHPEREVINVGFILLDALHNTLNSYFLTSENSTITKIRTLFPYVSRSFIQGRFEFIEKNIIEFKRLFRKLKNYIKLHNLQNNPYFKNFTVIVRRYVVLYKRMKKFIINERRKLFK